MKKFLNIRMIALIAILSIIGNAVTAQVTTRFTNRNFDERIAQRAVTTDSTLTYMDSVLLGDNEAGIVQLTVIGFAKDTAYSVRGIITVSFNKRRGTLTMSSITENLPIVTDAVLANAGTGSTFTLVVVNNNIYVRVKGKAAYDITWTSFLKVKSIRTYGG